jgi:hypothetical protein
MEGSGKCSAVPPAAVPSTRQREAGCSPGLAAGHIAISNGPPATRALSGRAIFALTDTMGTPAAAGVGGRAGNPLRRFRPAARGDGRNPGGIDNRAADPVTLALARLAEDHAAVAHGLNRFFAHVLAMTRNAQP